MTSSLHTPQDAVDPYQCSRVKYIIKSCSCCCCLKCNKVITAMTEWEATSSCERAKTNFIHFAITTTISDKVTDVPMESDIKHLFSVFFFGLLFVTDWLTVTVVRAYYLHLNKIHQFLCVFPILCLFLSCYFTSTTSEKCRREKIDLPECLIRASQWHKYILLFTISTSILHRYSNTERRNNVARLD